MAFNISWSWSSAPTSSELERHQASRIYNKHTNSITVQCTLFSSLLCWSEVLVFPLHLTVFFSKNQKLLSKLYQTLYHNIKNFCMFFSPKKCATFLHSELSLFLNLRILNSCVSCSASCCCCLNHFKGKPLEAFTSPEMQKPQKHNQPLEDTPFEICAKY